MTPKQKRAYNHAKKGLAELSVATIDDAEAFNTALQLLARAFGVMIGTKSVKAGHDIPAMNATVQRCYKYSQQVAVTTYSSQTASKAPLPEART